MPTTQSLAFVFLASFSLLGASACGDDDTPGTPDGPAVDSPGGGDGPRIDAVPTVDSPPTPDTAPMIDAFAPDGGPGPDALPANIACYGSPPPTTAAYPLALAGTVSSVGLSGQTPLAGATVEARLRASDAVVATATSNAMGAFSASITSSGVANPTAPWDGYGRVSASGYITVYIYPPDPLDMSATNLTTAVTDDFTYGLVRSLGGVAMTRPAGTGTAIVGVVDCLGNFVEGAVVSFNPPAARVTYISAGMTPLPDTSLTRTTTSGLAIGFDIPVGNATVSVDYAGMTWQQNVVKMYDGEHTSTIIHP